MRTWISPVLCGSGCCITVTSGLDNLAIGQKVSGVLPFPSGEEIFPPGTTITAINGGMVTASQQTKVDATDATDASLAGPTVLGDMYGGNYSTAASATDNIFQATGASNQVFQVTLTPG